MAGPITWRNVTGPSNEVALKGMGQAQESFGGAFDTLSKLLQQREAVGLENAKAMDASEEGGFRDRLAGIGSLEDLATQREALEGERLGMGLLARNATRGALDERETFLRNALTQKQAFDLDQRKEAARPYQELAQDLRARGEFDAADTLGRSYDWLGEGDDAEALKAARRGLVLEGRADWRFGEEQAGAVRDEQAHRSTMANQKQNRDLTGLRIQSTQMDLDDKVEADKQSAVVEKALGERLGSIKQNEEGALQTLQAIGRTAGFPLDKDGLPDHSKMSPEQKEEMDGMLERYGIKNLPTSSQHLAELRKDLLAQGVKPSAIPGILQQTETLLSTKTPLSAEDAATLAEKTAAVDAQVADAEANNPFYTPKGKELINKTQLMKDLDAKIQDGPMTSTSIRSDVRGWLDKGFPITGTDGKVRRYPVSARLMDYVLNSVIETDTWFNNRTTTFVKEAMQDLLVGEEYVQMQKEAAALNNDAHVHYKKELQDAARRNAGTVTPSDYLTGFERTLKNRKERTKPVR